MQHSDLELRVVEFLLRNAVRTDWLDQFMVLLLNAKFIKSLIFPAVLMALWFGEKGLEKARQRRVRLIGVFFAIGIALGANLAIQHLLASPRPVNDPRFAPDVPPWMRDLVPPDLNSFPSDHVLLFMVASLGVLHIVKPLGVLLLLWTLVVVAIPRVYLGVHYPIDILVSIPLGACAYYGARVFFQRWQGIPAWVESKYERRPILGNALLFIFLFEIGNTFGSSRALASGLLGFVLGNGLLPTGGLLPH